MSTNAVLPLASRAKSGAGWITSRHRFKVEALVIVGFWAAYEASRGLVAGSREAAIDNADRIVSLEQWLNVSIEEGVQDAAHSVPGLVNLLSVSYLTLHLGGTIALLVWLYRRRPDAFPLVRSTLLLSSSIALIGYLAYPTAPPRLANIGIADTVSSEHIDLNTGLVSSLYNPFAAVPSMHFGYAVIVAAVLITQASRRSGRIAGALYPPFVLLMIVATGNHFLIDAAAGAAVVAVSFGAALLLHRGGRKLPLPRLN